ncbi:MAG: hypothetical protein ABW046_20560 [Actinoplanes sp.]
MRKLNTFVHVVELDDKGQQTGKAGTFGPDDDVPGWASDAITNPDVWAGEEDKAEEPAPARGRRTTKADAPEK